MLGDQTEKRGHQGAAGVGAGHLNAHQTLGIFFAEIHRCGMDDAGINRCAAEADDHQTTEAGQGAGQGKCNHQDACRHYQNTGADHDPVTEFVGNEAVKNPSCGDADIEQCKLKRKMRDNSKIIAMLCDSGKFNKTFLCTDFTFDEIDYLITDKLPPEEYLALIEKSKCKLLCPETIEY